MTRRMGCFVLLAVFIAWTAGGCEALQQAMQLQKPTAALKGVAFQDVTLQSAQLLFQVEIDNPYPVDLPLLDLDYNLVSSAEPFLNGTARLDAVIPPKGSRVVTLPVQVRYLDLVNAAKQFKPGAQIPYDATVGLSVDTPVGPLRLPLSKQGTLALPNLSDLSDINWRQWVPN